MSHLELRGCTLYPVMEKLDPNFYATEFLHDMMMFKMKKKIIKNLA
jgi:hypothetical protein